MAVINNGLPSTYLKDDDIRDTLNANGGSVTNNTLTFFSTSAKINKWSKWKPIHIPNADFVDDETAFKTNNWGITPRHVNSVSDAFAGATDSDWAYTLPKGGAASPYRKGDFRNYRADATSPFRELELDRITAIAGDKVTATLYCRFFNTSNENGMLGLNDIGDLSGCNVIFIHKRPNGTFESKTSTETIASNHGMISATFDNAFTTSSSELGTHTYMAALNKNGQYYPLPINPKSVIVETVKMYTRFNISHVMIDSSTITGTAYFVWGTQESAASITGSVKWELTDNNNFLQQTLNSTQSSLTINRGEEKMFTLDWSRSSLNASVIQLAQQGNLKCRAVFNNGTYVTNYVNVSLF